MATRLELLPEQMHRNLLHGSSMLCHFPSIQHCSPFTSITHIHPSLLHRYSSFIQLSFHTIHPSFFLVFLLNLTPHIRSYCSLDQLVLLHSLHVSKPPQHTQLCSTSQLSCKTSSPSHLLISHSVHRCYSTHTPQTPHLYIIQSLPLCHCLISYFISIEFSWYSYSFIQLSLHIHPYHNTAKHILRSSQHLSYIIDPILDLCLYSSSNQIPTVILDSKYLNHSTSNSSPFNETFILLQSNPLVAFHYFTLILIHYQILVILI